MSKRLYVTITNLVFIVSTVIMVTVTVVLHVSMNFLFLSYEHTYETFALGPGKADRAQVLLWKVPGLFGVQGV